MNFGLDYERKLIGCLLQDKFFCQSFFTILSEDFFRGEVYKPIATVIQECLKKYGRPPDKQELDILIQKSVAKEHHNIEKATQEYSLIKREIEDAFLFTPGELEIIKDTALDFVKARALENAVLSCGKLIGTPKANDMPDIIQKALSVGTNLTDFGMDYFDKRKERAIKRYATPREMNRIPFFIPNLDSTIMGVSYRSQGSGNPELLMFGGGANVGKSRAIGHMVKIAAALGLNVVVFSAEQSEDMYAERLDMSISRMNSSEIYDVENFDHLQKRIHMIEKQGGKLFIKKFPSKSTKISECAQIVQRIQQTLQIEINLVCFDYTEEFKSERDYSEDRSRIADIISGQKKFSDEFGCAVVGASQLNREGMKSQAATLTDVGGDISVAKVADIIIMLAQTEEEYNKTPPEMRWIVRKARGTEKNQQVLLVDERSKMCFTQHPHEPVYEYIQS